LWAGKGGQHSESGKEPEGRLKKWDPFEKRGGKGGLEREKFPGKGGGEARLSTGTTITQRDGRKNHGESTRRQKGGKEKV